jgi:hypothetical protein
MSVMTKSEINDLYTCMEKDKERHFAQSLRIGARRRRQLRERLFVGLNQPKQSTPPAPPAQQPKK